MQPGILFSTIAVALGASYVVGDQSCTPDTPKDHLAFVQRQASRINSEVPSNRHLGATAEFNEAGYQQVLSTGSDAELTAFASRILESEELRVEEPQRFADFITSLRNSTIAVPFAAFKEKLVSLRDAVKDKVTFKSKEAEPKGPSQSQKSDEKPKELTGTKVAPKEPERNLPSKRQRKAVAAAKQMDRKSRKSNEKQKELSVTKVHTKKAQAATAASASPGMCPDGYEVNVKNLKGNSGVKSEHTDIPSCAQECCAREGCTSFETGNTTKYAGCYTYTGGDADLQWKEQDSSWISCIKTKQLCPCGYTQSTANIRKSNGKRTADALTPRSCAQQCDSRCGCNSFEVGTTTVAAGCWTYSGTLDIAFKPQVANWTTCMRNDAAPCTTTLAPITTTLPEEPLAGATTTSEPITTTASQEEPSFGGATTTLPLPTKEPPTGDTTTLPISEPLGETTTLPISESLGETTTLPMFEPLGETTTLPNSEPFADDSCANPIIYCGETVITDGVCNEDVFVKTPQVEFGINQHGTFGSEACPHGGLGFHSTSCGNGAGLGIVSSNGEPKFGKTWAGDFFIPGIPYEGWQVRVRNGTNIVVDMEGSLKDSSNHGEGSLSVSGGSVIYTLDHVGAAGEMEVKLIYTPHPSCTGISMIANITTKSQFDEDNIVYFARSIIPDQGQPWGEDFGTNQLVESESKGVNGAYSLVTAATSQAYSLVTAATTQGRTLSMLSCDSRSHAGIGGYGFLYDLPTLVAQSQDMAGKTSTDADQNIWTISKDFVPPQGTTISFTSEYLTHAMTKEEIDALFCVEPTPSPTPSPTESPTPSPTPSPTEGVAQDPEAGAEPTPLQTAPSKPSASGDPTEGVAQDPEAGAEPTPLQTAPSKPSASGDPHLVNLRGERFDIYKLGQLEFLRVPYQSKKDQANFTAVATIQDVAGSTSRCKESRYITSVLFSGAWLRSRPLEVSMDRGQMNVLLGGVQVKPSLQPLPIGDMVQLHMPDETLLHVKIGEANIVVSRDIQPVHFFLNVQATSLGKLGYRIGGLLGEDDHAHVSTPPAECRNLMMLKTPSKTQHSFASASI